MSPANAKAASPESPAHANDTLPARVDPTVESPPETTEAAAMPPVVEAEAEPETKPARRPNPARKVAIAVLGILFGGLGWHVASDLLAPGSATGSVTAFTAMVAPRTAGQVSAVLVADNQFVKAGDQLFQLDLAPFDLAVRQAEANLAQVLQTVDASVVSLVSTEAKVEQAKATLESTQITTQRTLDLFDRGLTSQAQVDTANAQLANARSALSAVQADLDSARVRAGTSETVNPQVLASQVQLEQAQLNRSFATVTAPTDGVITNLKLAVGQYVNAGSPALTFIESDSPWVVVDMRENQLANIQVGDPASVLFDALPGRSYEGRVRSVAWGIDTGRTAANGLPQNQAMARWFEPARTIPVHIELTDAQEWPRNVRVGSKASAVVFANGGGNPVSAVASFLQTIQSYLSYLY
ncbi:HlyD family secretion protein [Devosia epidermidihirudinis]|nr:HlyD family secretion protein [Devosia epidermidihirudinis]